MFLQILNDRLLHYKKILACDYFLNDITVIYNYLFLITFTVNTFCANKTNISTD